MFVRAVSYPFAYALRAPGRMQKNTSAQGFEATQKMRPRLVVVQRFHSFVEKKFNFRGLRPRTLHHCQVIAHPWHVAIYRRLFFNPFLCLGGARQRCCVATKKERVIVVGQCPSVRPSVRCPSVREICPGHIS